jgi:hypothetical protein
LKTLFTYVLFFALAFKPIYTIGYISYFELNIDYIVETYCVNKAQPKLQCNGQCHLAKQLNKVTNSDSKTPYANLISETILPVYFQKTTFNFEGFFDLTKNKVNSYKYIIKKYTSPLNKVVPPPKLS